MVVARSSFSAKVLLLLIATAFGVLYCVATLLSWPILEGRAQQLLGSSTRLSQSSIAWTSNLAWSSSRIVQPSAPFWTPEGDSDDDVDSNGTGDGDPEDDFSFEEVLRGKKISTPIYFIRHGEKPKNGGKDLSVLGEKRAQCLRDVFGDTSRRRDRKHRSKVHHDIEDIGYILVQDYDRSDGSRRRPYDTVKPIAKDLGLRVDHHCDRDDTACVLRTLAAFDERETEQLSAETARVSQASGKKRKGRGRKAILVCWEHKRLSNISKALGDKFKYPSRRYDLVFEMVRGKVTHRSPFSERCEGLDD